MSNKAEIQLLKNSELPHAIKVAFENLYDHDTDIAALTEQHIKPLQKKRTAEWRRIKNASNISRKTLSIFYAAYKAERQSDDTETNAEGERMRAELTKVYQACKIGEVMNFLGALEVIAPAGAGRVHPANGKPEEAAVSKTPAAAKAPHAAPIPAPAKETEAAAMVKPDNDWQKAPEGNAAEMTDAQRAGFDFNAGEKAGLAGKDIKIALKESGFHHLSARGKSLKQGWEAGTAARKKQLAEKDAAAAQLASEAAEAPAVETAEGTAEQAEHIDATAAVDIGAQTVTTSNVTPIEGGYQAKQGRDAGWAGKTAADNPYPEGSTAGETWERNRQIGARESGNSLSAETASESGANDGQQQETEPAAEPEPAANG